MSKHEFVLDAKTRANVGKGASRRLRKQEDAVPAIVYGGDKTPANVCVSHDKLQHAVANEAFFSSLITLKIDGTAELVVIKDLQRHPARPRLLHADFQRVQADHALHVKVPLHFINEDVAPGVKLGGGLVNHVMTEVDVQCLAKNLPEFIEVDLSHMNAGETLHLNQLKLPKGVKLGHHAAADAVVVGIVGKSGGAEASESEGEAAAE